MNVTEVALVLAYFASAHPSWDPSDDTADVWAGELADVPGDVGRLAAKDLVRSSTFTPSIAEFLERCRHFATRQRLEQAAGELPTGLGEPPPAEIVEQMRALLKRQASMPSLAPEGQAEGGGRLVPLPKSRCPRCGENTIPYVWSLEPTQVERPLAYDELAKGEPA